MMSMYHRVRFTFEMWLNGKTYGVRGDPIRSEGFCLFIYGKIVFTRLDTYRATYFKEDFNDTSWIIVEHVLMMISRSGITLRPLILVNGKWAVPPTNEPIYA